MARTRYVYPTAEIAHLWASQGVERASNPQHNFSFEGGFLKSYSTLIARIVKRRRKPDAVLILSRDAHRGGDGERGWSHTTSGQVWDARGAARHMVRFEVASLDDGLWRSEANHKLNVEAYAVRIAYLEAKASRARTNGEWLTRQAQEVRDEAARYIAHFGLRVKVAPQVTKMAKARAKQEAKDRIYNRERRKQQAIWAEQRKVQEAERRAQWEADAPARAARAERARIDAEQQRLDDVATLDYRIEAWRNGDRSVRQALFPDYTLLRVIRSARFVGGDEQFRGVPSEVETSRGARVPYEHARRLYLLWKHREAKRGDRVGHYTVEAVNGDLTIGCHVITRAEADALALREGWDDGQPYDAQRLAFEQQGTLDT